MPGDLDVDASIAVDAAALIRREEGKVGTSVRAMEGIFTLRRSLLGIAEQWVVLEEIREEIFTGGD